MTSGGWKFSLPLPAIFLTSKQGRKLHQKGLIFLGLRLRCCRSEAFSRWGSIWVLFKAAPSQETWRVMWTWAFKGSGLRHACPVQDLFRISTPIPWFPRSSLAHGQKGGQNQRLLNQKRRELTHNCAINFQLILPLLRLCYSSLLPHNLENEITSYLAVHLTHI